MEVKAHHLLVGVFVVVLIAGLFAAMVRFASRDLNVETAEYEIAFNGSVSGLSQAADVRYNGISVGRVASIRIDPDDPANVLIRIRIDRSVPIKADATATLQSQGLTGVSLVHIQGGSKHAPSLQATPGQELPRIPSEDSPLQNIVAAAPVLLSEATATVKRVREYLDDETKEKLTAVLGNLQIITDDAARHSGRIAANLDEASASLRSAAQAAEETMHAAYGLVERMGKLSDTTQTVVVRDVRPLLADARKLMKSSNELVVSLQAVTDENRHAIAGFTHGTLPEISRLVMDARRLTAALASFAEKLEDSPAEVLFANRVPEYEAPK